MPRDKIIKSVFENADDSMQAVIGHYYYVNAVQYIANPRIIIDYLDQRNIGDPDQTRYALIITHEWDRSYDPIDYIESMEIGFDTLQARTSIVNLISIFEGCLSSFIKRLCQLKLMSKLKNDSYKGRLEWAAKITLKSSYGSASMPNRLCCLCSDVDHARRIRNLWMHNNGYFNDKYGKDYINLKKVTPTIDKSYNEHIKNKSKKIQFKITGSLFEKLSRSHIEMLHHIHNMLQLKHFGQKQWYEYKQGKKKIEWHKLLGI